jgi:hypothetical protein
MSFHDDVGGRERRAARLCSSRSPSKERPLKKNRAVEFGNRQEAEVRREPADKLVACLDSADKSVAAFDEQRVSSAFHGSK